MVYSCYKATVLHDYNSVPAPPAVCFSRPVRRHRGGGGGTRRSGGPRCRPRPIFAGPARGARAGAARPARSSPRNGRANAKKQHKQQSSQSVSHRYNDPYKTAQAEGYQPWPPHTCISTCIILCSLGRSDVRAVLTLVLSSTLNIQVQLLMTLHTMLSESMSHCPLYRDSFQ